MLTVKSKDYLVEWSFLGNKLEKFPLAEFLGCFMSDLWHAWKCTERYVLLLSFAPTHFYQGWLSGENYIFHQLLSLQWNPNSTKQERQTAETTGHMGFYELFIFSGMCDVTIYSVKISSETKLCWAGSIGLLSKNDYEKPSNYSFPMYIIYKQWLFVSFNQPLNFCKWPNHR